MALVLESEELQSAVLVRNLSRPPGRGGRCDGVLLLLAVNCDFIVGTIQKTPVVRVLERITSCIVSHP